MCGISGFVLKQGERADLKIAQEMANDMRRRGPDAQTAFGHENFSFSHSRLKIIDVTDNANQPIFNEDRKVAVVFNGEIYNFRQLRADLESYGHHFYTNSDTEVIVHSFEEWGVESFIKFNGIFAFALWDGRKQDSEFYLVRDRFGAKPLFYGASAGRIAFSSEIKPLLRIPWITKEIDPQTLFYFLKYSHVPNPLSILKTISQLEPGHYLKFDKAISMQRYWNSLSVFQQKREEKTLAEWKAEFASIWLSVIQRQAVSDVPIGCFLSGGIDSSLIALQLSKILGKKTKTFSIGYKEARYDETPFAAEVADRIGSQHHEIIVSGNDFFSLIPEIPTFFDQPFADPSLLPTLLLSKYTKQYVSVALSGDGADELFWGYDYQRILAKVGSLQLIPSLIRKPLFSLLEFATGPFSDRYRKLFEIFQFTNREELLQYFIGTVGPLRVDRLRKIVNGSVNLSPPHFSEIVNRSEELNWSDQISYIFQNTFLVDTVLAKSDRASMAYGLETRVPFLDNQIVDFSARMPPNLNRRNGGQKTFLREIIRDELGEEVSSRPKRGFSVPLQEWMRGDLRYLLEEYIFSDQYRIENILNNKPIEKLGKEHLSGKKNHSHLLWSIICFRMWSKQYLSL